MTSAPNVFEFDPRVIPYQFKLIRDIRRTFNYKLGTHECLLSGSVGSAKSMVAAHLAVTHCLHYLGARLCLCRKAMPDLKDTIFTKILEHLEGALEINKDYFINDTQARIKFRNGSEIISRSWSDRKYKKMRSLELSAAIFEELTENDEKDKQAYDEIKMRVGRLPHVHENWIISCTNPDAPSHWAYKHFMATESKTRHVYYSVTTDNPFLPSWYIEQLKEDLDPKLARRMIYGEWIEIESEVIYYAYDKEKNFINREYVFDSNYPLHLTWDFNIGEGKPLSVVAFQFYNDCMHIFEEIIVEGMRTSDSLDEIADRGLLDMAKTIYIHGDATGRHRDTRNIRSDYDIIEQYLANYTCKDNRNLNFKLLVPLSNGSVRNRHNIVNAYCCNENGKRRLFVYKNCKIVDEGMRLTALKPGGKYIENDTPSYQHCTTAISYGLMAAIRNNSRNKGKQVIL